MRIVIRIPDYSKNHASPNLSSCPVRDPFPLNRRRTSEPLQSYRKIVSRICRNATGMKANVQHGRKRIFIVDDHPLIREWLATLIHEQGDLKVCGEARHAAEALGPIAAAKPHVVVVDISMQRGSRIEVIKNIQGVCPTAAVIVFSVQDGIIYGERTLRAGVRGYFLKRDGCTKMVQAIQCVLGGKLRRLDEATRILAQKFLDGEPFAPGFPVDLISDRQFEVFKLLGRGYGQAQIAQELHIRANTVRTFCASIKKRLKLSDAGELRREAVLWHDRQILKQMRRG
jgi:DNA-binding NarL/FixJ family response regulator